MGADRLRRLFAETRAEGRAAFLPYLTAGLPDPTTSPSLFAAMAEAGADAFEVGIPYSDPLMDGPVIQRGSDQAIRAGTTLDVGIEVLGEVTATTGRPALAMTYANPVLRRGVDRFCEQLAAAGADGMIVPDLPVEEAGPLRVAADRHGLGMVAFAAPTSDERRLQRVAEADPVFVYAVAEMGVTGERTDPSVHVAPLIERVRAVTDAPIVLGVGISTPEQARAAASAGADGVIVGSAVVRRVLDASTPEAAAGSLREFIASIAAAVRVGAPAG